jgi:hypothetical protein
MATQKKISAVAKWLKSSAGKRAMQMAAADSEKLRASFCQATNYDRHFLSQKVSV